MASRSFKIKTAERMFWAGVNAALGFLSIELVEEFTGWEIPVGWVPVLASAISLIKSKVARKIGDPNDPATLPAGV
jgi:hypothetical protein